MKCFAVAKTLILYRKLILSYYKISKANLFIDVVQDAYKSKLFVRLDSIRLY